jgi:hypothetical protein
MESFNQRIRERFLDYLDWVDFRRDPSFWPLLAVPGLALAGGFGIGWAGTLVIFGGAVVVACAVSVLFVMAGAAWIVANTLADLTLAGVRALRVGTLARQV